MDISIVTTLYLSAPHINEFYDRITNTVKQITENYEIIFVNDGSPDDSLKISQSIVKKDDKVKVIDLSRNFGHHKAIMTGLSFAKGNNVFLIDSDLEEEPELLGTFYNELQKDSSIDVIYGVQEKRKGSFFERITGFIFYKIINFLSDYYIPANMSTIRLMKKDYVENLIKHMDKEIFLIGLWIITGFNQKPVFFTKKDSSKSSYSFFKRCRNFVNAVTSFSNRPLYLIFFTGLIISLVSSVFIIYLFTRKLMFKLPVAGYTSIILSIWFLGGLSIAFIGTVGIYIAKIFSETKERPYTIVKKVYEKESI